MKKITIAAFIGLFLITLQSCLKDNPNTDFSNLGYVTEIVYPPVASAAGADAAGSGLAYFASGALTYPSTDETDTAYFMVNLASPNPMSKDLPVTISIASDKLNDNFSSDGIKYDIMPDSDFTVLGTTGVIPAGKRLDTFYVVFYPAKIDATKNYGLPITIASADGTTISSNFGTLYFHTIGNPIAGTYEEYWSRWNLTDTSGGEATALYYKADVGPVIFAPINPTSISVFSGGTGDEDIISFTNTAGTLSDFSVAFNSAQFNTLGITLTGGPIMEAADPVHGYYRVYFTYLNSSGSARCIVNEYIKQ